VEAEEASRLTLRIHLDFCDRFDFVYRYGGCSVGIRRFRSTGQIVRGEDSRLRVVEQREISVLSPYLS